MALVDAAISRLAEWFGRNRIDLAGFSGGRQLIATLLVRRTDVDRAVIASGNGVVRHRLRQRGLEVDVTGLTDFVDPLALVADVAGHPPRRLTVPQDETLSTISQAAWVEALRAASVGVDHQLASAPDPKHQIFPLAAILPPLLG